MYILFAVNEAGNCFHVHAGVEVVHPSHNRLDLVMVVSGHLLPSRICSEVDSSSIAEQNPFILFELYHFGISAAVGILTL